MPVAQALQANIGFQWKADGVPVLISNARLSLKGVNEIEDVPRQTSLKGVIESPLKIKSM
ncbi:hypothetical protein [Chitinophaga polysaccharea]|uniref:hypothetical protein n=1 Tax=Chitinophaga polysaccharea TaxID=1293035 RepID=UPI00115BFBFB|nr:hypothetical protein [Chitinophaga polysaccharea]